MRILIVSGEFPPMRGGVGDYTREVARALVAQGHEVHVVVPAQLAADYDQGSPEPWRVWATVADWRWGCWQQVGEVVRTVQPDVVNIQYQAAAYDMRVPAVYLLPWRLRRISRTMPVIVTCHDLKTPYLFPKAGFLRNWVVRQLVHGCNAAIVTNVEDLDTARGWSLGVPIHRIPIGSNVPAVPPEVYDRERWRAAHGYGKQDVVWAYFGFLNETKGGETLVEALALAPPTHRLLMIGDRVGSSDPTNRSYAARVEALMAERGVMDRVQWTGYLPVDHVPAALLSADMVVLPYRDGASFRRGSLHAALAIGCPILSTVPRVRVDELVDGENVCLVPPDDPHALSQAAQDLGRDSARRARLAEGARELGRAFTWERITQRTVDEVFRPLVIRAPVAGEGR